MVVRTWLAGNHWSNRGWQKREVLAKPGLPEIIVLAHFGVVIVSSSSHHHHTTVMMRCGPGVSCEDETLDAVVRGDTKTLCFTTSNAHGHATTKTLNVTHNMMLIE